MCLKTTSFYKTCIQNTYSDSCKIPKMQWHTNIPSAHVRNFLDLFLSWSLSTLAVRCDFKPTSSKEIFTSAIEM